MKPLYSNLDLPKTVLLLLVVACGLFNTDSFYSSITYYVVLITVLLFTPPHFYLSKQDALTNRNILHLSKFHSTSFSSIVSHSQKNQYKNRKTNTNATVLKDTKAKNPSNISGSVCFVVSTLFLFSCLINFKLFINNGLFNYFAFVLGSGSILTAVFIWKYRTIQNTIQIIITIPFVLFLVWALFVFVQSGIATQYKYNRIAVCFAFLISFIVLRKNNLAGFYKAVATIATIESLWCILQYFDKIPSENPDFDVTGSFVNPNVVAMFLALCIPALLHLCFKAHTTIYLKVFHYVILLIVCVGLLLLECRTAILGGILSSGLFLALYFDVFKRYKRKYLFFGFLSVAIVSAPLGKQFYLHKKDSADGRVLIWRLTAQMIQDAPLRGYGTGMFEKEYNLKQAKEIQEKKLSKSELKNASFVLMAYNDYLEQAVQGGFPAVLLFIIMLASFLFFSKKEKLLIPENQAEKNPNNHYIAYAGIASFALMAVFNFTLSAIPVLLLLCTYAGILCANTKQPKLIELSIKPNIAKMFLLALAGFTFYITCGQLNQAKADRKIKRAYDFLTSGYLIKAEKLLSPLQESEQNSVSFCLVYGNLLYEQHKYKEALYQFNYAKKFSANPTLYEMAARCLLQSKDYKGAITNLQLLTALSPKTMKYKFGLMQVLLADKQIKQARRIAQQIVTMPIINANELTDKYLKEAKKVLKTQ